MPVQRCEEQGQPGFKYGESGACYTYTNGDKRAQQMARSKAAKQGRAIEAEQQRRKKDE